MALEDLIPWLVPLILLLIMILASAIKIVKEYERGVIFRLGRLVGARGPGLFFIIPIFEAMVKLDLRTTVLDVPSQEVITRDNALLRGQSRGDSLKKGLALVFSNLSAQN